MKNFLLFLLCCLAAGIASAQTDEEKIKAAAVQFSSDFVAGNYAGMANAYTEDALLMPPGREPLRGKEEILKFWTRGPGSRQLSHRTEAVKIVVEGDTAHDYGFFYGQGETNGQAGNAGSGKYYIIWKKDASGQWKMAMDMWNTRDPKWNEKN